jgi:hypothetical protein
MVSCKGNRQPANPTLAMTPISSKSYFQLIDIRQWSLRHLPGPSRYQFRRGYLS